MATAEDLSRKLTLFPTNRGTFKCINLLVVSSYDLCEKLKESLLKVKHPHIEKCQINLCENIEHLLKSNTQLTVDFIIFAPDIRKADCITQVKKNIEKVDPAYLINRCCVVNGIKAAPYKLNTSAYDLLELKENYGFHILVGDVFNENKCLYLAKRILELVSVFLGAKTGFPFIDNIPSGVKNASVKRVNL